MSSNTAAEERALAEHRRAVAAAQAADARPVAPRGALVVLLAAPEGEQVVGAGEVSYARHGLVVVRCADDVLRAHDVTEYRQVGERWEAVVEVHGNVAC